MEVGGQAVSAVTPALDDNRILAPLDFKVVKGLLGGILIDGLIYELQIPHELLLVLAGHILDRVAYLVYDAELDRSLRENTCNRIRKALESVNTGNEGILDTSVLEIRKDAEPEVGSLALGYVHAKKLFPSLACKGQYIIDGSCHWTVLLVHYLIMHRIKPHDGIHPVQRPVFPALYLRKDTVRYAAYCLCRYAVAELLLKDVAYLSCAVADGVQAYDSVRK